MKVLHLIDSGGLYGAENMLLALVNEQVKLGLTPMILSAGEPGDDEKPLEIEARRLGLPITAWRMNPGLNLPETRKIITWAQDHGYELMHSHGYKFNILVGLWPRKVRRLPLVTTLHGYVRAPRFSKMWIYEMLDRLLLPRMEAVVLVDKLIKADLGGGLRTSGRVQVIPNGVNMKEVETRAKDEPSAELTGFLSDHYPVILGVGRLSREKAFERLINAFEGIREHYPNAGLLIVGEGRLRSELEHLAHQRSLRKSILMPGFCDNVPALMAKVKALVIPSITEGLPITLLEAMTLKLPVVASAVGAIPEVLEDGEAGWIVGTPDIQNFIESIAKCLDDHARTDQKIRRARERVSEIYSSTAMAQAYTRIYQQLAD